MTTMLRIFEAMCDWRPAVRNTVVLGTIVVSTLVVSAIPFGLQAAGII